MRQFPNGDGSDRVCRLTGLEAVGVRSAWTLVAGLFAWRQVKNGKEPGALVGLTPAPFDSGKSAREQGISGAANTHVRGPIAGLAWRGLR
jgi:transposase